MSTSLSRENCRIVSGGQTGVDRAALDAGMHAGVSVGGWCPRGRRAENGTIPARYPLQETAARSYAVRTEWNVRDSDGTLILVLSEISSGTRMTIEAARSCAKPVQIVHLHPSSEPGLLTVENSRSDQLQMVVEWMQRNKIRVLNVAGPRGSSSRLIYPMAREFLEQLLEVLFPEYQTPNDTQHGTTMSKPRPEQLKAGRSRGRRRQD